MIQVTRQLLKRHWFNHNGFEKTECVGKKLKNIAPNVWIMGALISDSDEMRIWKNTIGKLKN